MVHWDDCNFDPVTLKNRPRYRHEVEEQQKKDLLKKAESLPKKPAAIPAKAPSLDSLKKLEEKFGRK